MTIENAYGSNGHMKAQDSAEGTALYDARESARKPEMRRRLLVSLALAAGIFFVLRQVTQVAGS